jgi:hypothetical protein
MMAGEIRFESGRIVVRFTNRQTGVIMVEIECSSYGEAEHLLHTMTIDDVLAAQKRQAAGQ